MAGFKLTQLTEDTSPSSSDLAYSTKDPAGTPLDRKVTWLNILKGAALGVLTSDNDVFARIGGVLTRVPVSASTLLGRKATGDVVALTPAEARTILGLGVPKFASSTLTDKTSVASTSVYEQWGTEEATVAQASAPSTSVNVVAMLSGTARNLDAASRAGDVRVQVSFDGGSTWSSGTAVYSEIAGSGSYGVGVAPHIYATGTVTGDLQARAQVANYVATTGPDYIQGRITLMVFAA